MKRKLFLPVLLIAVLFAMPSCKKAGNTGLLVPEDAAIVFHINNASLSSKLSWEEIRQTNWFKELSQKSTDSLAQKLIADPSQSGIDTKADFVIFLKKQGKNGYVVFEGSLKDAAAFEAFNKKVNENATTGKDGSVTFMSLEQNAALVWNSTHFTYVMGIEVPDMQNFMGEGRNDYEGGNDIPADSLKLFGKNILNLKGSGKLDNDSRFVAMIKDGSDMHLWMNTEEYYGDMFGPMLSMMGNFSALTKGNISASSFSFDNGKMTMKSKQYYGKELSSFMSKNQAKPVSAETAGRIPSQNVVAAIAMNYPPEALADFIKLLGMDGIINLAIAQTGYSIDEFVKANKGELLLAVSDLQIKKATDSIGMAPVNPDMKVLFATAVNDKAAFEKLITLLSEQVKDAPMEKAPEITYKLENNWFAAGNSAEQVNQFLAGGTTKAAFADRISGHPFGFFIDINRILRAASAEVKDSSGKAAMDIALNTWQEVVAWGGEYKDKATEFHAEVTMVDKNTNSLKQLNSFIDKIATILINEEKTRKETEVKPF